MEPVLKYFKVSQYYDQDCLKISSLLSTLLMMIQISGKGISLALKSYLIPINKVQSFLKSNI